jgi:hypothetical protein
MLQARYIDEQPRIRNPRSARGATDARVKRSTRARYTAIARFSLALVGASVLLLAYVMLTSNLTGMTYTVSKAKAQRAALQEETARLDDRLSTLRSQDRLSMLALKLGMREPTQFALVLLPQARPAETHVALLAPIAEFFTGRAALKPGLR